MFITFYPVRKARSKEIVQITYRNINNLQSFKFSYFKSKQRKMVAVSHVFNNAITHFI